MSIVSESFKRELKRKLPVTRRMGAILPVEKPINKLKGLKGDKGSNGIKGKNGKDGKDGTDGRNGTNGVDGTNGTNGIDGKKGDNGTDGKNAKIKDVAKETLKLLDMPTKEEFVNTILNEIKIPEYPRLNDIVMEVKKNLNIPKAFNDKPVLEQIRISDDDILKIIKEKLKYSDIKDAPSDFSKSGGGYLNHLSDVDTNKIEKGNILSWTGKIWKVTKQADSEILKDWRHYKNYTRYVNTKTVIPTGEVYEYIYVLDGTTIYRFVSTEKSTEFTLYRKYDTWYTGFDGTDLTDEITTR